MRQPQGAYWRARLGRGMAPVQGKHVWLHGASNGELASASAVLERLGQARPDLHWLVTANTETGVQMVEGWHLPRVSARLAPLDLSHVSRRVIRDWRVVAHISLESELWPHRFRASPGPVILLGARMSAGTAKGLARLPGLARAVLSHVTLAIAQDQGSLDRLSHLGLPEKARGPVVDLKALYQRPAGQVPDEALRAAFNRDQTWLAASTHEGEDEIVLQAHAETLRSDPDLRLILAPRHPRRGDALEALINAHGFTCARRSKGEAPGTAQVYLADTMGEMAIWYALAGRVFIAGTLSDRGGHTPYEPAQFGAALLYGPDVVNHRAGFERLAKASAAVEISDALSLAKALLALSDPSDQRRAGKAAQEALHQDIDMSELCARLLDQLATA
ncbi:3-deoxy-D-manno-octulosonic acid transferase [Primorskyibacter sp. 2E233]|uniref:3-deoxy-D-manno-octulosonic acid transferase n=1 Tax=Primorskyibacter sp. 2E233 TaxID=3413431 RepID=UPI003BF198C6